MFGKLLSKVVDLANVPLDAVEKLVARTGGEKDLPEDEKIASMPLKALSDAMKEIDSEDE